jgi:hypothetical protein
MKTYRIEEKITKEKAKSSLKNSNSMAKVK